MSKSSSLTSAIPIRDMVIRFLWIYLPVAALVIAVSAVVISRDIQSEKTTFEAFQRRRVLIQHQVVSDDLAPVVADLLVLAGQYKIHGYWEQSSDHLAHEQEMVFKGFIENKNIYDQIRFIDEAGMEVTRVNFRDGKPYVVPAEELQSKADRYYFKKAFALEEGAVFISPMDLNVEKGRVERPFKPMIRFATPVFDNNGRKMGVIVINYLALARGSLARRQAHREVAESLGRVRAVMDNVVDAVIIIDEEGIVREYNPAARKIFGYTAEEVIGRNVNLLMPEPNSSRHDDYLQRYQRTGEDEAGATPGPHWEGMKVLVAEDLRPNFLLMERILKSLGVGNDSVGTGRRGGRQDRRSGKPRPDIHGHTNA